MRSIFYKNPRFIHNFFNKNLNDCYINGCFKHIQRYQSSAKKTHPSADRNSQPISAALLEEVDKSTPNLQLLEIASGSGQHVGYFAPLFPNITFQPTENETQYFKSIRAYAADCVTNNIKGPLYIDVSEDYLDWPEADRLKPGSFDYMFNSNMMHITPWVCSIGLFRAAGLLLKPKGCLFTYGPYALDGVLTPESNVKFDISLKERNLEWGIRDIVCLKILAANHGMVLKSIKDMPSNNKFLTWAKE